MTICGILMRVLRLPDVLVVLCYCAVAIDCVVVHWEAAVRLVMTMDDGSSITEAQLAFTALLLIEPIIGVGALSKFDFKDEFYNVVILFETIRGIIFGLSAGHLIAMVLVVFIAAKQVYISSKRVFLEKGTAPFINV